MEKLGVGQTSPPSGFYFGSTHSLILGQKDFVAQGGLPLTRRADNGSRAPSRLEGTAGVRQRLPHAHSHSLQQATPLHAKYTNVHPIWIMSLSCSYWPTHLFLTIFIGTCSTTISVAPRQSSGGSISIAYGSGYHVPRSSLGPCPRTQTQDLCHGVCGSQ